MGQVIHRKKTQKKTHPWSMSDTWVDANIMEWHRLWNDGLTHDDALMQSTDQILRENECKDSSYFTFMAMASLGIDPFDAVARKRMNIDQAASRAFALVFFAKLSHDIGETRLRKRFDVLVERGEVKP